MNTLNLTQVPNFIGGDFVYGEKVFEVPDVYDQKRVFATIPISQAKEINKAVSVAQQVFNTWKSMPAPKRGEQLEKIGEALRQKKSDLARIIQKEIGKSEEEALGEVQEAIDSAFFFSGEGRRLYGRTSPSELSDKLCMTLREPVGVVALVTPWNFPIAVPSWKLFAALICGNSIIIKPSEYAPASCNALIEVLAAHLPEGLINIIHGPGVDIVPSLIAHPAVRMISFTGSTEVGRSIMKMCGEYGKKVSVELGGNNAQIVLEDADIDLAVNGALWGAFATSGQRCTSTSRIMVHKKIESVFMERFLNEIKTQFSDIGIENSSFGPLRKKEQLSQLTKSLELAKKSLDIRLVSGGELAEPQNPALYFQPTVFFNVKEDDWIFQNEVFGPVVGISIIESLEEGVKLANGVNHGLSSAIYTKNINLAMEAVTSFDSGIVYVNAPTIGAETHLPFGGTKGTGNGFRDSGVEALEAFSEHKTVYIDYSGRLQKAQIDR
jgi:alpha-ketoglutaric semialdehyde dehydrogenase